MNPKFDPILSHHPNCPHFDNHVLKIGEYRLCIGCFIGYPSAVISFTIGLIIFNSLSSSEELLFKICRFGFFTLLIGLTKYNEKKPVKIMQKLLFGCSSGIYISYSYYHRAFLGISGIWLIFVLIGLFLTPIMILHLGSMGKKCENCVEVCPFHLNDSKFLPIQPLQEKNQ